jgi:hypothetical protein
MSHFVDENSNKDVTILKRSNEILDNQNFDLNEDIIQIDEQPKEESSHNKILNYIDKFVDVMSIRQEIDEIRENHDFSNEIIAKKFVQNFIESQKKKVKKNKLIKYIPVIGNAANSVCSSYADINNRTSIIRSYLNSIAGVAMTYDNSVSNSMDLCGPVARTFSFGIMPSISDDIPLYEKNLTENAKRVFRKASEAFLCEIGFKLAGNLVGAIPVAGGLLKRGVVGQKNKKNALLDSDNLYKLIESYELLKPQSEDINKEINNEKSNHGINAIETSIEIIFECLYELKNKPKFFLIEKYSSDQERNIRKKLKIGEEEIIMGILDDSLFGSCKQGVAFTNSGVFWSTNYWDSHYISYGELINSDIEFEKKVLSQKINIKVNEINYIIEINDRVSSNLLHNLLLKIKSFLKKEINIKS